jgi:hypothetical protein
VSDALADRKKITFAQAEGVDALPAQLLKNLPGAKRLRLTLLPAQGSELSYDFDVAGAAEAIKSIPCKETGAH